MEEIMRKLLELTMYGSLAIVLVIVFRFIFRKAPKKITCLFWIAVAFRLICPVNFSTGLSIMNLFDRQLEQKVTYTVDQPADPAVDIAFDQIVKPAESKNEIKVEHSAADAPAEHREIAQFSEEPKVSSRTFSISEILAAIWITGVIMLLGIQTFKYIKMYRTLKVGQTDRQIVESDRTTTPFLMGFFSPKIVIPTDMDESEKDYIIHHERVHIRYKDNLTRTFGYLLCVIHWFNPLVWLAYAMMCNDLEMRVDETVIDEIGGDIKKSYCKSIVRHAVSEPKYGVFGSSFAIKTIGGMEIKMRINNLIKYKRISLPVSILIVVMSVGMTIVFTSCAEEKVEETSAAPETSETTVQDETTTTETTEDEGWVAPWDEYTDTFPSFDESALASSEYLKDYGESVPVNSSDVLKIYEAEAVDPEYYKGTDLYEYAVKAMDKAKEGADAPDKIVMGDYSKRYEMCGGVFFKEGFFLSYEWHREFYQVVKTDRETLEKYLKEFGKNTSVLSISENDTDDGRHQYNLEKELTSEDGRQFTQKVTAVYDEGANVAIIIKESMEPLNEEAVEETDTTDVTVEETED